MEDKITKDATLGRETFEMKSSELERLVDRLGDFYQVSSEQKEQVKSADFLFLESESFRKEVLADLKQRGILAMPQPAEPTVEFEAVAQALGKTAEEIQQQQAAMQRQVIEKIIKFGGICQMIDNRLKIMIKVGEDASREKILKRLKHEIYHGFSTFDSEHSGLQSRWGICHYLNEAATEILRIHEETQTEVPEMLQQIKGDVISDLGYKRDVERLLATMLATYRSEAPVTISRLADYYFNRQKEEVPGINAFLLWLEIARNADPKFTRQVNNLLEKLYR